MQQSQVEGVSQLCTFHVFVHLQQELVDEGRSLLKVCTQHTETVTMFLAVAALKTDSHFDPLC